MKHTDLALRSAIAGARGQGGAAEPVVPVFVALGPGTRFFALALFVFNAVAVISYPGLNDAGLKDHVLWGALMLVILFHGPGKLSLDQLVCRRLSPRTTP